MQPDPAIDEVREIRRKISAEYGDDPRRFMEHYRKMEEEMRKDTKYNFYDAPIQTLEDEMVLRDKPTKKTEK